MLMVFYILLFALGAVMGSFGGVIIERGKEGFAWKERKKVFGGRSYCPGCNKTLTWWQLIPLVGWLVQKGKCFRCSLPIPKRYMREEIVMGCIFVVTGFVLIGTDLTQLADSATSLQLLFRLLFHRGLVLLLVADLFWYELNLYVRILLMSIVLVFQSFGWVGDRKIMLIGGAVLGMVFYGIYGLATRWQTRKQGVFTEGLGMGDVRMAVLLGAGAGLFPSVSGLGRVQLVLVYLILSSGLGIAFWYIRKIITHNADEHLPFLPAMIVAFLLLVNFSGVVLSVL